MCSLKVRVIGTMEFNCTEGSRGKALGVAEGGNIAVDDKEYSVNPLAKLCGKSMLEIVVFQIHNWLIFRSGVLIIFVGSCYSLPPAVIVNVVNISEDEGSESSSWGHYSPQIGRMPRRIAREGGRLH